MKYSLDNITKLVDRLGNPQNKVKTIHVGGTNGKGSSSHMLASVLQTAGYKTGLFTSPHLKSFTERIKINGQEISEIAVIDFVAEIERVVDEMKPSFFEITFAMAMQHFYKQEVDYAVIEVGLGGRLDSTNIISPEICLITNISQDHVQFLGSELPGIAKEKAGIIKASVPIIISEYQKEVAHVFIDKAAKEESEIKFADKELLLEHAADNRINIIDGEKIRYEGLKLDLRGPYQQRNVLGVLALIEKLDLNISDKNVHLGLANVVKNTGLKGRWQIVNQAPLTILDTGHNKSGIQVNLNDIEALKFDGLHMVWGMVDDKDIDELLELLPEQATYYFVKADVPRAMPAEALSQAASRLGLSGNMYPSVMDGYKAALASAKDDDLVFVGGSTFVVAEIEDL